MEQIQRSQVLHRYLPRCLTVFSEDAKVVAEQVLVQKVQTALMKLTQQDKEELVPEEVVQLALHPMGMVMQHIREMFSYGVLPIWHGDGQTI